MSGESSECAARSIFSVGKMSRRRVRPLAISLVLATILGLGLPSLRGNAKPVEAGQSVQSPESARSAAVAGLFAAVDRGDIDAAAAQFADNGILAGAAPTNTCYRAHPCTDATGIRAQLQYYIEEHDCRTVVELNVAGTVVTGRMEDRSDGLRALGVEHGLQSFMAVVPQDKITFLAIVFDTDSLPAPGSGPVAPPIPTPNPVCG